MTFQRKANSLRTGLDSSFVVLSHLKSLPMELLTGHLHTVPYKLAPMSWVFPTFISVDS